MVNQKENQPGLIFRRGSNDEKKNQKIFVL